MAIHSIIWRLRFFSTLKVVILLYLIIREHKLILIFSVSLLINDDDRTLLDDSRAFDTDSRDLIAATLLLKNLNG